MPIRKGSPFATTALAPDSFAATGASDVEGLQPAKAPATASVSTDKGKRFKFKMVSLLFDLMCTKKCKGRHRHDTAIQSSMPK